MQQAIDVLEGELKAAEAARDKCDADIAPLEAQLTERKTTRDAAVARATELQGAIARLKKGQGPS